MREKKKSECLQLINYRANINPFPVLSLHAFQNYSVGQMSQYIESCFINLKNKGKEYSNL